MITVTIEMEVIPSKRQELLQTLYELSEGDRKEKGFLNSRISIDTRHENVLTLIEDWETQEDLITYLQSEYFRVLLGALQLLTSSSEISFSMVAPTTGEKIVHTVGMKDIREFSKNPSFFALSTEEDERKNTSFKP